MKVTKQARDKVVAFGQAAPEPEGFCALSQTQVSHKELVQDIDELSHITQHVARKLETLLEKRLRGAIDTKLWKSSQN